MMFNGTPSRACAWRSWWGTKRRRTPRPHGESAKLTSHSGAGPRSPASRAVDDAEQRPDRQLETRAWRDRSCSQPHSPIPTSRRRPPWPLRTRIDPRRWSTSCSASASASPLITRRTTGVIAGQRRGERRRPAASRPDGTVTKISSDRTADAPLPDTRTQALATTHAARPGVCTSPAAGHRTTAGRLSQASQAPDRRLRCRAEQHSAPWVPGMFPSYGWVR